MEKVMCHSESFNILLFNSDFTTELSETMCLPLRTEMDNGYVSRN